MPPGAGHWFGGAGADDQGNEDVNDGNSSFYYVGQLDRWPNSWRTLPNNTNEMTLVQDHLYPACCGRIGHSKWNCPTKAHAKDKQEANFVLAVRSNGAGSDKTWTRDSSANRNLVRSVDMLEDTVQVDDGRVMPNGDALPATYPSWDPSTRGDRRNEVLIVAPSSNQKSSSSLPSRLEGVDVVRDSLMDFQTRLAHVSYDTIERMAAESNSGIELTDRTRVNRLTCAQSKQSKNAQSKMDTVDHSPIDRIADAICSDLTGSMTPSDRRGNRYMANKVDHKSNYCRLFVAKTKDVAAKMLKHFLVYFEKRFNCRAHVLRTDGGGEYSNVNLICKSSGVARQISEANNQASNGKAERMDRTVMNMARSMIA